MKEKKEAIINVKAFTYLIIVFIIFNFSSLFQYIPVLLFRIDISTISNNTKVLLSIFSNLCLLTILLLIYRKSIGNDFKIFKKNIYQNLDTSVKYYLLGVLGMIVTNIIITNLFQGNGSNNEKLVQSMIKSSPYLMILNAGIIAPITEELVFRKAYINAFNKKDLFIILSGYIFGVMHVIYSATNLVEYLYFIPYMSLGLSFAAMDYKERNVIPSICMHMFHNTLLIILSIMTIYLQ